MWLIGCNDGSQIGSSIADGQITVTIDSAFTVTGHSQAIEKVQSRTISQLFGRIDAAGYGRLSSDVVTQFMPATPLDTNIVVENIDSLHLVLGVQKGEFIGDSIAPLGINVYRLNKQLPSPIYSDFDPTDYFSSNELLSSTIYNISDNSAGKSYSDGHTEITVKLPVELGRDLFRQYEKNPSSFSTPSAFAEVFPGLYIKNSYGSGRLTRVTSTLMKMYYHYSYYDTDNERDTTVTKSGSYFAVTPEIISNNNVAFTMAPTIKEAIEEGENVVMAPVGLEVEMRFPAPEIIAKYKSVDNKVKVLNSVSFSVPAEEIENDFGIVPPQYLLLVPKNDKEKFFAENQLPDNVTSFYATYNSTTNAYSFGEMREFILDLMKRDSYSEDDYTFAIVPVAAVFETVSSGYYYTSYSQVLSLMTPYMASPVMAKLRLDKATVRLAFATQNITQ